MQRQIVGLLNCRILMLLAATMLSSCSRSGDSMSSNMTDEVAPPEVIQLTEAERQRQRVIAQNAQQELMKRLSGRLMDVLSTDGAAAAIKVCSEEAQQLTKEVGERQQVAIGRTSFRLRNQENQPPKWAQPLVEQRVEQPAFVDLPTGQLGALLPIRLQAPCLLCHGATENISDDVKEALASNYPLDQATGFELDALRGWFWIEVPAPNASTSD